MSPEEQKIREMILADAKGEAIDPTNKAVSLLAAEWTPERYNFARSNAEKKLTAIRLMEEADQCRQRSSDAAPGAEEAYEELAELKKRHEAELNAATAKEAELRHTLIGQDREARVKEQEARVLLREVMPDRVWNVSRKATREDWLKAAANPELIEWCPPLPVTPSSGLIGHGMC